MFIRQTFSVACRVLILACAFSPIASSEAIPREILRELESKEFRVREQAQEKLLEWSRENVEARVRLLLEQARLAPDPEVRQRNHNVLQALAMDDYMREGEGFIGIQMIAIRARIPGEGDEPREVISITRVLRDTPAVEAGLRVGDMIAAVNGDQLEADDALQSFQDIIRALKPGTAIRFEIVRDGELIKVEVKLGRRPPDQQARFFGQAMMDINELARRDRERFFKQWLENLEN